MAGNVILSARMQAVADMVTKGNRVCDVGCDHGYVSIYLVQSKVSPSVLAMDVNKGPLLRAREHVADAGLKEYITLRLSDGLSAYERGEADTLICAGMGGRLMQRILAQYPSKARDFKELILQPQSEISFFRRFLRNEGYSIVWEDMILEEDKFYPVIKAVSSKEGSFPYDQEICDRFGPVLLQRRHPVLNEFLKREWQNSLKIRERLMQGGESSRVHARMKELDGEMLYIKKAAQIIGADDGMEGL